MSSKNEKQIKRLNIKFFDFKNNTLREPCDVYELVVEKRGRWYIKNCKSLGYEYDNEINNETSYLIL